MYLYGRTFIMETDHKPLEMISLKNLTVAPACLQRMLLHLQQYDLAITYQPGREMLLVDALSHLPSRMNTEIELDLWVNAILMFASTPIMADLPSPAKILHGHPAQGAVLSRPSKRVSICQIRQTHWTSRKTERTLWQSPQSQRSMHSQSQGTSPVLSQQCTGPVKWTTGTMTEILECGQSYMIQGPNGRVYRRNRAHLKPICHEGSSFQDHLVEKRKKQSNDNSFQDHQPSKAKSMSFQKETSYMDTRSMFDEPDTHQTTPTITL